MQSVTSFLIESPNEAFFIIIIKLILALVYYYHLYY